MTTTCPGATSRTSPTAATPPIPEAPPQVAEPIIAAPVYEDDLDVPAYLRQGKLLN